MDGNALVYIDGLCKTFQKKDVRDFLRKTIKSGKVCAFNTYFESKHFDEIFLTIRKHLNIFDNKISTVIDKCHDFLGKKEKEYQTIFIGNQNDYCKTDKKEMADFVNKKLGDLEVCKALRRINKADFLVLMISKV